MKTWHVLGGALALGLGILGVFDEYFVVVEFIKGSIQPLLALVGMTAIFASLLSRRPRMIHLVFGLAALGVGIYGFFDEYYATLDFFKGAVPLALLFLGTVSVVAGVKQMG
jgi:hypothetical protein